MGRVTRHVRVHHLGTPFQVSRPADNRSPRGILLFHHRTGFDGFTDRISDRLTAGGWTVVAPDLFAHLPTGLDPEGLKRRLADEWVLDAARSGVALLEDEDIPASAGIGFCMGGRLSFLAATAGVLSAAVCFYGGDLDVGRQDGPTPLSLLREASGAIQLHRGSQDSAATGWEQDLVVARAVEVGATLEACTYAGARHAFLNRDDPVRYSQRYAARAWAAAMTFLEGTAAD